MTPHDQTGLCPFSHCDDCAVCADDQQLLLVAADLGKGAFLAVLCNGCWHRRNYRRELELRRDRLAVAQPEFISAVSG